MATPQWFRDLDRSFSRFARPAVRWIIYVNTFLWLTVILLAVFFRLPIGLYEVTMGCTPLAVLRGFVWQFFTYMWVHIDFMHLFFNMLMLFFFGSVIEQRFGTWRFLRFYIICGIGAAVVFELITVAQMLLADSPPEFSIMYGASGATYAVLFAFAYFYPNQQVLLWFVLPIKVRYLIAGIIIFSTVATLNPRAGDNVAHLAHLAGIGMAYLWIKWGDWFGRRGPRKVSQREWNDLFGG